MKNWQIILWLIVFFPVGLYLMFRYSDWQKPVKYGITGVFILAMFLGGAENWAYLFLLGSVFASIVGLFAVFRKKSRGKGLTILALGLLVFTASSLQINEYMVQEQLAIEAEAEAERLAEEERLAEIARQEEQERLEKEQERLAEEKRLREEQEQLKEEAIEAVEAVEESPTQVNYDKALRRIEKLESEDETLMARLDDVLPEVEAYEELAAAAEEAIEQAQESKDRAAYEQAYEMVESLPVARRSLTRQLEKLDDEIEQVEEEERLAAEKAAEEERKAQEKAAEEQRIAAEQEAQRQAEAAAASQQASSGSSNSSSGNTAQAPSAAVTPPVQNDNVTKVVYIAPQSGTKYHYSASCRGLNRANSIQEMSLSQAQSQGYELCGWES